MVSSAPSASIEIARAGGDYGAGLAAALTARATLTGCDPAALSTAGVPELPTTETAG
ncbi:MULTISPECIES: hypothetical protein [unclassified Streptomyces]|uniref:hypothetical protein n=1 Tax=unclassified Streptomyces TaxID=2593676 RepID=UPI00136B5046|nr:MULTISPECIES: hypothetical protein [unclassified Streptomyces]MYS23620.1 hypothetical protein [Streptomyces sp. SID4948]